MFRAALTLRMFAAGVVALAAIGGQPGRMAARGDKADETAARADALKRAQVWHEPSVPIDRARFGQPPIGKDGFRADAIVNCQFDPKPQDGGTPKFDCRLRNGDSVKVKYGAGNAEIFAEVIGSRLLTALGFWADRMYVVAAVRCAGCPQDPFEALRCMHGKDDVEKCFGQLDPRHVETFKNAVIERPVAGRRIEIGDHRGWSWTELNAIHPEAGGAPAAHIDALRLMAVFLNHWDSKAENQRLLCLGEEDSATTCARPVAMIQDLGASFGPKKLNVVAWEATPFWTDAPSCLISLRHLPDGVSTFPDIRVSEAGRRFLADRLGKLTASQIRELFTAAHISQYVAPEAESRDVNRWMTAFAGRVRALTNRPPCP